MHVVVKDAFYIRLAPFNILYKNSKIVCSKIFIKGDFVE